MTSDSTILPFRKPGSVGDPMTAILRDGARRVLAQAIEAEAVAFLAAMKGERLADGRDRIARHGLGPVREIQSGIGPVAAQRVKLRDRGAEAGSERIRFTSALLPPWARRTRSLDALLPILYLRGISMGDFQDALGALLGKDAPNLSPSVVARLRGEWESDFKRWQRRDLSARRYVYIWADG
ncbi:transposase, partial [Acidiphilium rubrum]